MKIERYNCPWISDVLPMWVRVIGMGTFGKGEEHFFPNPQFPRFFWCESGAGEVFCDGTWMTLDPSRLVFWARMDGDQYVRSLESDWKAWWWTYDGPLVEQIFNAMKLDSSRIMRGDGVSVNDLNRVKMIAQGDSADGCFDISSWGYEILTRLVRPTPKKIVDPIVGKACRYIDENLSDSGLSVNSVAEFANINRFSLTRHFQQTLRTSPIQYILRKRINLSIKLINTTDSRIAEIAEQCGFCDAAHFAKQFKALMGQKPSDLRKE